MNNQQNQAKNGLWTSIATFALAFIATMVYLNRLNTNNSKRKE